MTKRQYECVLILNAALEDGQIDESLHAVENFISANDGKILDNERWGRKRLAYVLNKSKTGYYSIYRFTASPEMIFELERNFRIDENIIRYLTIQLDKNAIEHYDFLRTHKDDEPVQETKKGVKESTSETKSDSNDSIK